MTWVVFGVFGFLLLAWFLFLKPGRRDFEGLSETQLQRYIAHATVALENGGWISIRPASSSVSVSLRKRELKKTPPRLTLRFGVGGGERESIERVAEALEHSGIEHRRIYTKKLRLPRAVEVTLACEDPLVPAACTQIARKMLETLVPVTSTYGVFLAGPFKRGFSPEDGEVIPHNTSWRYGHALGYFLGSLARSFRNDD